MVLKDLKTLTALGLDDVYMSLLTQDQRFELLASVDKVIEMGLDSAVSVEDFELFENTQPIPDVDGVFGDFLNGRS